MLHNTFTVQNMHLLVSGFAKVLEASPCDSLSTGMQCEMDPVSQTRASESLAERGFSVVGWYHSHPTFAASPSIRDIETQAKFQVMSNISASTAVV